LYPITQEERIRVGIRKDIMRERRHEERRDINHASSFIFVDTKGRTRSMDRRRVPDRRLNNIIVEFIPLDVYYNSSIE
jgi:hypothetical protein